MTRLDSVSSQIVEQLRRSPQAKQRAAALAAARFALAKTAVDHADIMDALSMLETAGALSRQQMSRLGDLAFTLDDKYFRLKAAADEGSASSDDYLGAFGQARAVAAIRYCADDDPFVAAAEAIYEAALATDSRDDLLKLVEAVLATRMK